MAKDWRDEVFVSTRCYIFQGDIYCEECGNKIKKTLKPQDNTGDSNDYPQGPYTEGGGESDAPQFCGSGKACAYKVNLPSNTTIGCPLGNHLTREGVTLINDKIRGNAFENQATKRSVARLCALLYGPHGHDVLTKQIDEVQFAGLFRLPRPLVNTLKDDKTESYKNINKLYVDVDNLYFVGVGKHQEAVVGRIVLEPDGNYGSPELVRLPHSELTERTPLDIISACVEDAAWD